MCEPTTATTTTTTTLTSFTIGSPAPKQSTIAQKASSVVIIVGCSVILSSGQYINIPNKNNNLEISPTTQNNKMTTEFTTIKVLNIQQNYSMNIDIDDAVRERNKTIMNKKIASLVKLENFVSIVGFVFGVFVILSNLLLFDLNWFYVFLVSIAGFTLPMYIRVRRLERKMVTNNG